METSLRYSGDSKALRIHAKQRLFLHSYKTHLQVHGELDSKAGGASYLSAMIRHFYPNASASVGLGVDYEKREKVRYVARAKKSFPVTNDGSLALTLKARCETKVDHSKDFNLNYTRRNSTASGAAHLSWSLLDFQPGQDLRLKLGFRLLHQVPYIQIRENNWTLNADGNGKWNLRFDL